MCERDIKLYFWVLHLSESRPGPARVVSTIGREDLLQTCGSVFDRLAKILTGYEITGARSSGIFMGILSGSSSD
ncbi:hypothetical protein Ccrd_015290 [Cynara cardunculus var. scolymus]|uniref:Uncharacterized protein n=1 Tax=Cynara cardunculus var. scolymus TaxID=59895 RepID=A0A103YC62_CYNCS|nr:hypothetical protein Ccrd_015290 [Cynara cardunculus var. scolymus]